MAEFKMELSLAEEDRDVTRGEARALKATYLENEVEVSILEGEFTTLIPDKNGQLITIANDDHTIIETTGVNVGRVNIALSALNSERLPTGKKISISTKVVIGDVTKWYWGYIDQVRAT